MGFSMLPKDFGSSVSGLWKISRLLQKALSKNLRSLEC